MLIGKTARVTTTIDMEQDKDVCTKGMFVSSERLVNAGTSPSISSYPLLGLEITKYSYPQCTFSVCFSRSID